MWSLIGNSGGGGGNSGSSIVFELGAGGVALAIPFRIPNRKKVKMRNLLKITFIFKINKSILIKNT
jgi:hypothetical protein